jgi:hypothetical protein
MSIIDSIVLNSRKPLHFKNTEDNKGTMFYIGLGKTGSMTLCNSIQNQNIFHSHGTSCYDHYNNNILTDNNLTCYDLVKMFGKTYNYKPLIIETIREPISILLSLIGEFSKASFKSTHPYNIILSEQLINEYYDNIECDKRALIICKMVNVILETFGNFIFQLENDNYFLNTENFDIKLHFNKQNNCLYKEFDEYSLLIMKFENIKNWSTIFNNINVEYNEKSDNQTKDSDFYPTQKYINERPELLNLTTEKLKNIYSQYDNYLHYFYTDLEINNFINKWKCN